MSVNLEDIKLLKKQHTELDRLLKEEEESSSSNSFQIQKYKKEKLLLKEKIQKTESEFFEMTP